jgi:hypothetical protein
MAITLNAIPVEEYLRTCYEPDMEYVDGRLVERNAGDHDHSLLQSLIVEFLTARGRVRRFGRSCGFRSVIPAARRTVGINKHYGADGPASPTNTNGAQ